MLLNEKKKEENQRRENEIKRTWKEACAFFSLFSSKETR